MDIAKFDGLRLDDSVRPLDQAHVIALSEIAKEEKFYQTPIIGYQTGDNIWVVDGNHRIKAILLHNENNPNDPIKDITFTFLIRPKSSNISGDQMLTLQQKLTLISLAEDSAKDFKKSLTKIQIMRNSRVILKNCPEVLGIPPLPKNGRTNYHHEKECQAAIADFFHVSKDLVLRIIWKVVRISDEDSEKIFDLFEKLPSGFTGEDYDLLFNKYPHGRNQVLEILRSIGPQSLTLSQIQKKLKNVEKEFFSLLKDYGAYNKDKNEKWHFDYIAGNAMVNMENGEKILAKYISAKTKNLHRQSSVEEKLNFFKKHFKTWLQERTRPSPTIEQHGSESVRNELSQSIPNFPDIEWFNNFLKPQIDNGYEAAAAICVYSEIQRLRHKKALPECYKFFEKYLLDDKTFDYRKLFSEKQKEGALDESSSNQSESNDSAMSTIPAAVLHKKRGNKRKRKVSVVGKSKKSRRTENNSNMVMSADQDVTSEQPVAVVEEVQTDPPFILHLTPPISPNSPPVQEIILPVNAILHSPQTQFPHSNTQRDAEAEQISYLTPPISPNSPPLQEPAFPLNDTSLSPQIQPPQTNEQSTQQDADAEHIFDTVSEHLEDNQVHQEGQTLSQFNSPLASPVSQTDPILHQHIRTNAFSNSRQTPHMQQQSYLRNLPTLQHSEVEQFFASSSQQPSDAPPHSSDAPQQPRDAPQQSIVAPQPPRFAPQQPNDAPPHQSDFPQQLSDAPQQSIVAPQPRRFASQQPSDAPPPSSDFPQQPIFATQQPRVRQNIPNFDWPMSINSQLSEQPGLFSYHPSHTQQTVQMQQQYPQAYQQLCHGYLQNNQFPMQFYASTGLNQPNGYLHPPQYNYNANYLTALTKLCPNLFNNNN
uniref:Uncharacterized protein n=1 Tax=Panagrolaimus sp. ES5 TaxID=591445 RepID=A0AC34FK94_9BILA